MSRGLSGRRVLVARARPGVSQLAKQLRDLGADVTESPRIEVAPASDRERLERALDRVAGYGAVVFACEPGVEQTLARVGARPEVAQALAQMTVVAVGAGATAALRRAGIEPRVTTDGACVDELRRHAPRLRRGPILLVASEEGRPSLVEDLSAIGATVEVAPAYRLVRTFDLPADVRFDLVVLPSSSAAAALLANHVGAALRAVPMIAMGPKTEAAARTHGAARVSRSRRDTLPSMLAEVIARLAPSAREPIRPKKSLDSGRAETRSVR